MLFRSKTRSSVMPKCAAEHSPRMSELESAIERYLDELRRANASPHTIYNYTLDLKQFVAYFTPPKESPISPTALTPLHIREWLGNLYERNLDPISIRRKLGTVRSLFRHMTREGTVPGNVAKLVRTPKAPKRLPVVPTAEHTNGLIDDVAEDKLDRPYPERDLLIFELLYGCGLRISELVGLNLDSIDATQQNVRVLGKGRKERQVPYGSKVAHALNRYLAVRKAKPGEGCLIVNRFGSRLTRSGAESKCSPLPRWTPVGATN